MANAKKKKLQDELRDERQVCSPTLRSDCIATDARNDGFKSKWEISHASMSTCKMMCQSKSHELRTTHAKGVLNNENQLQNIPFSKARYPNGLILTRPAHMWVTDFAKRVILQLFPIAQCSFCRVHHPCICWQDATCRWVPTLCFVVWQRNGQDSHLYWSLVTAWFLMGGMYELVRNRNRNNVIWTTAL